MLRMGGYLETTTQKGPQGGKASRRPLQTEEIEPLKDGKCTEWHEDVNGIFIYISGSKTDWLNQGMARSHNLIPEGVGDSHLCPLRILIKICEISPPKFQRNADRTFATWRSGKSIKPDMVVSMLRMAAFEQCLCPSAFSLHSMRAGGATALYRATGNVELVARMGRWGTRSISAYLWGSREVMRGLGLIMAQGTTPNIERRAIL